MLPAQSDAAALFLPVFLSYKKKKMMDNAFEINLEMVGVDGSPIERVFS